MSGSDDRISSCQHGRAIFFGDVGFDDFTAASEPVVFQIFFFSFSDVAFPQADPPVLARLRLLLLHHVSKQMQLRIVDVPFTGLTEEFAFKRQSSSTQLLDRLLCAYGLSQLKRQSQNLFASAIIPPVQHVVNLSHSNKKRKAFNEALRRVISKKDWLEFKQLFDR